MTAKTFAQNVLARTLDPKFGDVNRPRLPKYFAKFSAGFSVRFFPITLSAVMNAERRFNTRPVRCRMPRISLPARPQVRLPKNPTGNKNWTRAVRWQELSRGRRIHDLRHTAATLWLTNHVDPKTVQTWLGHASMTMTVDTYGHFMGSDADIAAIARVNAVLGTDSGPTEGKLRIQDPSATGSDR